MRHLIVSRSFCYFYHNKAMVSEKLKLQNQLRFPVYAASRLIIREYQPFLDKIGLTYPQYLVLLVLWETDGMTVNEISQRLILNTNTVTPLLQRMEATGIIVRQRSGEDERRVLVNLTEKGKGLQLAAAEIPEKLSESLLASDLSVEELMALKQTLHRVIAFLSKK